MASGSYQSCPKCCKRIFAEARKCRHCGEILEEDEEEDDQVDEDAELEENLYVRRRTRGGRRRRPAGDPNDKSNATVIFATSLFGCFSPIVLIYGILFLAKRPYDFEGKTLAIIGTVLHAFWSIMLIVMAVNQVRHGGPAGL